MSYKIFPSFKELAVRSDGTTHSSLRVGRDSVTRSVNVVLVFELPDLKGADISTLQFDFWSSAGGYNNIDVYGVKSSSTRDTVTGSDFSGGSLIASSAVLANNTEGYSAISDYTAFATWLRDQYTAVGVGGFVYIRLQPDVEDGSTISYRTIDQTRTVFNITSDGTEDAVTGTGTTVSCRMGQSLFTWEFDVAVNWGYFIDGQPWITLNEPTNLVAVTPARLNSQTVYLYPSTSASPVTDVADINITVINPPVTHTYSPSGYIDNAAFGWDLRTQVGTSHPDRNATIGWDGVTPVPVVANDIITTPRSITSADMVDRASVLEALACLTVLSSVPDAETFRPSPLSGGTAFTLKTYSQLIDLTSAIITDPTGVTTTLDGSAVTIEPEYHYEWAGQQLRGPGFINSGYSLTEGCSALYNNTSYLHNGTSASYGGYMGSERFTPLAIGCVAGWMSEDERRDCRIRYIQRAIDTYGAVEQGLCLEEGAGILPGYSTMILTAGTMLNDTAMKGVGVGVGGVKPWFIFADYATTFHTGVDSSLLVPGETDERLVKLAYTSAETKPELNKENVQEVKSATINTLTMNDDFFWGDQRPMYDVVNVKLKVKSGAGAGTQTYLITASEGFINSGGVPNTGANVYGFLWGGTVTVKPDFQNGTPDATSVIDFSITTSKVASAISDDARFGWYAEGIIPSSATFEKERSITLSPKAAYTGIQVSSTFGNFILLYSIGAESLYYGCLDKFTIQIGERVMHGETVLADGYLDIIDGFIGALWKQEVLDRVSSTFVYSGGTVADLSVPDSDAIFWNGESYQMTTFHPAGNWTANNKYEYPSEAALIAADALQNLAGTGPYMFDGSGVPIPKSADELMTDGIFNFNKQGYACLEEGGTGLYQYSDQLTNAQDGDAKEFSLSCFGVTYESEQVTYESENVVE